MKNIFDVSRTKRKIAKFIRDPRQFLQDIKNPIAKRVYTKFEPQIRKFLKQNFTEFYYYSLYRGFLKTSEFYKLFISKDNPNFNFITLPWTPKGHQCYVREIMGAKKACFPKNIKQEKIDVFCTWGETVAPKHNKITLISEYKGRPLIRLEYGFISGKDIAALNFAQYSLIMSPWVMYYDSHRPSFMDFLLNSGWNLTVDKIKIAKNCIENIINNKLTKYNAGSKILQSFKKRKGRHTILLVDQRKGDLSVSYGNASEDSFDRMFLDAYKQEDADILLKIHPDALKGGFGSYLAKYIDYDKDRVFVINEDVNPYVLFDECDEVFVVVSGMGFEAALYGKPVTCYGIPFYSGWGFTNDKLKNKFRHKKRSIIEFFYIYYILCSRYFLPNAGSVDLETFSIQFSKFDEQKATCIHDSKQTIVDEEVNPINNENLKIAIVIPSPRYGATGINCQRYAMELCKLGADVRVYSEGNQHGENDNIKWRRIRFDGSRLTLELRKEIINFCPDIVYLWGCRTKAQRCAIEALLLSDAKLVLHYEDDDTQVFANHNKDINVKENLTICDSKIISSDNIVNIFTPFNISHLFKVYKDVNFDRWVDPLLRQFCLRIAAGYSGIWFPFVNQLKNDYAKESILLPPSFDKSSFPKFNLEENKLLVCNNLNIDHSKIIIFINGSIYTYSNEFDYFVKYISKLNRKLNNTIHLIFIAKSEEHRKRFVKSYDSSFDFSCLENVSNSEFDSIMMASDVMASPGLPDSFTRYRVPSRFVVPMALGKPVLLHSEGFGASLTNGENAIVFTGTDVDKWVDTTYRYFKADKLKEIGQAGSLFAQRYFNVKLNAKLLFDFLIDIKRHGNKPF